MKSYLTLIPISAKVHRRQNRMTLLCIIFAVFLVTAVFSMAEMGVRMEQTRLQEKHGTLLLQDFFHNEMGQSLFCMASVLFVLILAAGVFMISGSINSNVAQRTRFFGMMRCIGMSKQQITRLVRLEALNWCKTAIPIGVLLGIISTWGLCTALRFCVGEEFCNIPVFGISLLGIISGIIMGVVTVLIAASAPAKRAAKAAPITAVLGNNANTVTTQHPINTKHFKIETALGIHHAVEVKKSLLLMMGSFALSIILFLSFSVLIDWIGYMMPQSSSVSDIEIVSDDGTNIIDRKNLKNIDAIDGVKRIFGRRSSLGVFASWNQVPCTIDLISYDDFELKCLKKDKMLKRNSELSKVLGDSHYVFATWDKNCTWKIGDKVVIGNEELEIAGLLTCDPFSSDGLTNGKMTLITSDDSFRRITGIEDYSLVMIQTAKNMTDEGVTKINEMVNQGCQVFDRREQNTNGTYTAFVLCVYGFLLIITCVSVLNIINNISMSVSAKIKQYGAMRAVGMDEHQITKMIAAEAFTYAAAGCCTGCIAGLILAKLLFNLLISSHYQYAVYSIPVFRLTIIALVVIGAALAAIYGPSKRIKSISVTETINEL